MAYYRCNKLDGVSSGAVANFTTPIVKPLVNLTAYFKATQEAGTPTPQSPKAISGVSSVKAVKCGANLVDIKPYNEWDISTVYAMLRNSVPNKAIQMSLIDNDTSVDISGIYFGFCVSDFSGGTSLQPSEYRWTVRDGVVENNRTNLSVQGSNILTALMLYPKNEQTYNKFFSRFSVIISPNIVTTYEPYKGNTEVINLGGTYYGGYVTQDKDGKRELVVTMGFNTANEIEFKRSNNSGLWANYLFYGRIVERMQYYSILPMCNKYQVVSGAIADLQDLQFVAPKWSGSDYVYICDNNYTTPQDFVNANQDLIIVYELAEPFSVALPDGEPITAFNGVNNIYNDSGDTSAQFIKTYLGKICS